MTNTNHSQLRSTRVMQNTNVIKILQFFQSYSIWTEKWNDMTFQYAFTSNTVQRIYKNLPKSPEVAVYLITIWRALRKAMCRPDFQTWHWMVDLYPKTDLSPTPLPACRHFTHGNASRDHFFISRTPTPCDIASNTAQGGLLFAVYVFRAEREASGITSMVIQS
jgi:hypothetical protein